ncbi:MAG: radical SAM protein [Deltaproteobacteria bacterium]|nr:radical SAM protein [Deltaproteobacteria bacterium]
MLTVRSLLEDAWYERYKRISHLNIRSSIYDVTDRCNLRCKGCFFFSSDEHRAAAEEKDLGAWEAFIERERTRGVNLAILIGGEPTLYLDRIEAFYRRLPTYCATNGLLKAPRDRFPEMMVGISLWGDEEDERELRGRDTFAVSSRHYAGDPLAYYLYTITPRQVGRVERMTRRIRDVGLKVHYQLLSNDEGADGFNWEQARLAELRAELDGLLERYPDTVVSARYYHEVLTTGRMFGRPFGWNECPSVTESMDTRQPRPRRLIRFVRWASDLRTTHRCCTSATRDCSTCKDGAAHMSWIMVSKHAHLRSAGDLRNWIEVYEMFAKLYRLLPW